jgi:DNA polymerase
MGIPVWVSRELIVEDETISEASQDAQKQTQQQEKQVSSAESIMESLDNPTQKALVTPVLPTQTSVTNEQSLPQIYIGNLEAVVNEIGRTSLHTLFASGDVKADWLVIGQSPDVNDSAMNQPYPHESGELLNNMLRAVGIEQPRTQSYWLNVLKSPKRVENKEELAAAIELNKLLNEKIKQVQPKMVLLVGQLAAQNLLQSKEPLARLRLQQHKQHLQFENSIPTVVTYYPSYLLSKPQDKAKTWDDLKLAMKILSE